MPNAKLPIFSTTILLTKGKTKMTTALGTVRQVACVVDDMEQALNYWIDVMNAGPFFLFEHAEKENQRYRGGASNVDVSLAAGNSGDVQIELIYCENNEPSVYKEFLDAGRTGVHHLGLMPENCQETYDRYVSLGHEAALRIVPSTSAYQHPSRTATPSLTHTVRYTKMSPTRFKGIWKR